MADDRVGACRPRSMRGETLWRGTAAWALVCFTLLASPALVCGQADEKPAANAGDQADSGLPPNYEPPRDPPPEVKIVKRLLSPEDQKRIRRELNNKYLKRLRNGDLRDAAKTDVLEGIRYRLNELTDPEQVKNLTDLRNRLTGTGGDLFQAGKLIDKADQLREFRRELLQMIVAEVEPLFENNYFVRIQAALILGELNWMEEDLRANTKAEAFAPAAKPLIAVLADPKQPEPVKIVSVFSLRRILTSGNPSVEQKREIATALVSELSKPPGQLNSWYQWRLAEALGHVDVTLDLNRQPFVFNALDAVMNDPQRELRVRTQAAWSLARHPLDNQVDAAKLVVDVASLGKDVAAAQEKAPKNPELYRCALQLYLAFQAKDETDHGAKGEKKLGGLLNEPATAGVAKDAYAQVLPIVREIIAGKMVPPEHVQDLGKWLEAHGHREQPAKNEPPHGGNDPAVNDE